jgi:hypothetical protein
LENRLSECRLPSFGMGICTMDDPGALENEIALQRRRLLELLCEETAPAEPVSTAKGKIP